MDQRILNYLKACKDIGYVPEFYWDMDGVLCDFVEGACRLCNVDHFEIKRNWPRNTYWLNKIPGLEKCIELAEAGGVEFWESLRPDPKALENFAICSSYANTFIVSDPHSFTWAVPGKKLWIKKWLGNFTQTIFTTEKVQLAAPGRFLVDDYRVHLALWQERGGVSIRWPQPWNER